MARDKTSLDQVSSDESMRSDQKIRLRFFTTSTRRMKLPFPARKSGLGKKMKSSVLDMLNFRSLEHQSKKLSSGQLNIHFQNYKERLELDIQTWELSSLKCYLKAQKTR